MSKFTTEVRYICEVAAGLEESVGYDDIDNVVAQAESSVMPDYPIFDENYRTTLNTKILKHYYMREIGLETVGLWKHYLSVRMNEIMPYYNKLYESELIKFNPIADVDVTVEREGDTESNKKSQYAGQYKNSESGNDENLSMFSNTPQGGVRENFENATKYITNATKNENNNKRESSSEDKRDDNSKINSTEKYIEKITGKRNGTSYAGLIKEFRQTFLNIDMMVIEELEDLFFGLWE